METSGGSAPERHAGGGKGEGSGEEGVERRLAHFAFVREERDREVRLSFRDVPPHEIAAAFRAVGAKLISIAGERTSPAVGKKPDAQPLDDDAQLSDEAQQADALDKNAAQTTQASEQPGDGTITYFFDVDETIYTVSITVPSKIVGSVVGIYPSAHLGENELQKRLGMTFAGQT